MKLNNEIAKVIIIGGKARVGKDTSASFLKKYFEEKNFKVITLAFASYIKMYAKNISNWDGSEETKPRSLLQELGTEIIRKKIDEDFFIKRIIEDIKVYSYFFDIIIITDARIDSEFIKIKNEYKDATSIYIERPNYQTELKYNEQMHLTETGLDNYTEYDYIIKNDNTLEDLKNKIIEIGSEIK